MRQAARRSKSGNAPRRLVGRQASEEQALRRWHAAEEAAPPARQGDALEDGVQAGEELAQALGVRPLDAGDPVIDLARLRIEQHRQGIQRSHGARGADEQVGEFIHLPGQCSPPAGRDPKKWSARASREAQGGALAHTLQQPAVNALVAIRSARLNSCFCAHATSPAESHSGCAGALRGTRVGSTAQSAAQRSGCASPRSKTPLPPKLKPVRYMRAASTACFTQMPATSPRTSSAWRAQMSPAVGSCGATMTNSRFAIAAALGASGPCSRNARSIACGAASP